jgi:hypothetical protein
MAEAKSGGLASPVDLAGVGAGDKIERVHREY